MMRVIVFTPKALFEDFYEDCALWASNCQVKLVHGPLIASSYAHCVDIRVSERERAVSSSTWISRRTAMGGVEFVNVWAAWHSSFELLSCLGYAYAWVTFSYAWRATWVELNPSCLPVGRPGEPWLSNNLTDGLASSLYSIASSGERKRERKRSIVIRSSVLLCALQQKQFWMKRASKRLVATSFSKVKNVRLPLFSLLQSPHESTTTTYG